MATRDPITLHQGNDETVLITITPDVTGDDLTAVTAVELYLKIDACDGDDATTTVKLDSGSATELVITAQSATEITAEAYIPASALSSAYPRFYRVDGLVGAARRTAVYGPVKVIDL